MRYIVTLDGERHTIAVEEDGHTRSAQLDARELMADWRVVGGEALGAEVGDTPRAGHYSLLIGDSSYDIYVRRLPSTAENGAGELQTLEVTVGAQTYMLEVQDERAQALASLVGGAHVSGDVSIRAPMPGLVSNVLVAEGDTVERGQAIVVLEAMKMENDLSAPRPGVVKGIRVAKGQTVNQGDTLAVVGDLEGQEQPPDDEDVEA